jgi:nucleotide sugar dehydrogenase
MKISICGCGFVGNAVYQYFSKKTIYDIKTYDLYKNIGSFENIIDSDIMYICLPTLYTEEFKSYDMTEIDNTLFRLDQNNYKGVILIKSTIIPTYCIEKNRLYPNLFIMSNPEFLTARTANEDFQNQSHIIIGYTPESKLKSVFIKDFYSENFPNAVISVTDVITANLTKLACNSFYSVKIQFFTEIYLLCEKLGISYDEVKNLMIRNNWINPMHMNIPGPDNKISFGGACFPKDISALNEFMKVYDTSNDVINATIMEQKRIR